MAFLVDGFSTLISFGGGGNLSIAVREVQPPELDAGGKIETTTMHNTRMRTFASKKLVTVGDITLHAQYDPDAYVNLMSFIGVRQQFTITFPDGSTLPLIGAIEKMTPPSHKEGDFPIMEVKLVIHSRTVLGVEIQPAVGNSNLNRWPDRGYTSNPGGALLAGP